MFRFMPMVLLAILMATAGFAACQTRNLLILQQELSRYKLKRPTLAELVDFLRNDQVDNNSWIAGRYTCIDFARDLKAHARTAGWNISFIAVQIELRPQPAIGSPFLPEYQAGHALNGAYLANGTWIIIEPQTDEIYNSIQEDVIAMIVKPYEMKTGEVLEYFIEEYSMIW